MLDSDNSLWLWNSIPYPDRPALYDENLNNWDESESRPSKVCWFENKGLRVLDVKAGKRALIIKCENIETSVQQLYAMPFRVNDLKEGADPPSEQEEGASDN